MTPEEILENRGLINGFAVEAFTERVVAAMEEYADQFKPSVKAAEEAVKETTMLKGLIKLAYSEGYEAATHHEEFSKAINNFCKQNNIEP